MIVAAGISAFLIGFAANRGGTCAVMAVRELVERRRTGLFVGFALAASAGGLVYLPAVWASAETSNLFGGVAVGAPLLVGAVLLGVGANVNGACLLGSLWRLGNGEFRLLALPVGLAIGDALASRGCFGVLPVAHTNPFAAPGVGGVLFIASFLPVLIVSARWLRAREAVGRQGRWRLSNTMFLLGLAGALLFVLQPSWTYADVIRNSVAPPMRMTLASWGGFGAATLTAAGAVVSAIHAGAFRPRLPSIAWLARTVAGGILMAIGASLIPGGNDRLLLADIPAGMLSGFVAYVIMTTVFALSWPMRRATPARPTPVSAEER